MEDIIHNTIYNSILEGDSTTAAAGAEKALKAGLDPAVILNEGMIAAMVIVVSCRDVEDRPPEHLLDAAVIPGQLAGQLHELMVVGAVTGRCVG